MLVFGNKHVITVEKNLTNAVSYVNRDFSLSCQQPIVSRGHICNKTNYMFGKKHTKILKKQGKVREFY